MLGSVLDICPRLLTQMVLSSRLANRIGVRRPNAAGAAGVARPARGGIRRPVQDAREVLNARGVRGSATSNVRRLGVAGGGIVKTGRLPNLRLNTLRGAGRGGLRSDRMASAAVAAGRMARPVVSTRFQTGRQAQVRRDNVRACFEGRFSYGPGVLNRARLSGSREVRSE